MILIALLASAMLITVVALARRGPARQQLLETKLGLTPLQANPQNSVNYESIVPQPQASVDSSPNTPPSADDVAVFQAEASIK
jgi:hypothetical protein